MERDRGYTDEDMVEVSDNPEWTEDEFARAKPFPEVFPDLAESLKAGIQIVRVPAGGEVSVRLTGELAAYYESFGAEAEARFNGDLRKLAGIES